jgi:cytochrome c-type biogenesis protein
MGFFAGILSALWLGIMTSISPCPLATNVAAISFLSKRITHPALVFIAGCAYTLGRMTAYAILGFLLVKSILGVPQAAQFLQKYVSRLMGPVLIGTGLVLLEIIRLKLPSLSLSDKQHKVLSESGIGGAFALGFIFALFFCPVSAALFFGSLIPLAVNHSLGATLTFIYGVGTGLPVLVFAVMIAAGAASLSHWFHRLARLELYMRTIAGIVFVIAGIYYSVIYLFKLS